MKIPPPREASKADLRSSSAKNAFISPRRAKSGPDVVPYVTVVGNAVDVEKPWQYLPLAGNVVLTYSSLTPVANTRFKLRLSADGTARTVTLPASHYSVNRNGEVSTITVPANATIIILLEYTGARWEVFGDPVATQGTGSFLLSNDGSPSDNDVLTWSGTSAVWAPSAGGGTKTYARFTALDNNPPAANFATIDTRNSLPVLEFDGGSTDESAVFLGILPQGASLASGLKVTVYFCADTSTDNTKKVKWGVKFADLSDQDLDSFAYDTAVVDTNGTTINATNGVVSTVTLTVTTIDSLTAQKPYALCVYRVASDTSNDTLAEDAQLISVEVYSAA